MWLTHFWHSWSQFFIFAWDVTAGGILRTGVLICPVVNWTLRNKFKWNFDKKTKLFIHENASENIVCEKVAILSLLPYVKRYPDFKDSNIHVLFLLISWSSRLQGHAWQRNYSLTHWGCNKMAAIFQTTFWDEFSWMKIHEFWLIFHWNLFPGSQLTIFQHWFR